MHDRIWHILQVVVQHWTGKLCYAAPLGTCMNFSMLSVSSSRAARLEVLQPCWARQGDDMRDRVEAVVPPWYQMQWVSNHHAGAAALAVASRCSMEIGMLSATAAMRCMDTAAL